MTDAPDRPAGTILLAEDEYAVRALCSRVLSGAGFLVLEAADGAQAVALARSHAGPIDLLVTDVVMPNISGREAADAILALRPETRVLYMSGYTEDDIVRHGVLRGLVAFLPKPFPPAVLLARVRDVLRADEESPPAH